MTYPPKDIELKMLFFFKNDLKGIQTPHNDAVVVSMIIAKYDVKRVLVDNKSSTDILFYDAFLKINLTGQLR